MRILRPEHAKVLLSGPANVGLDLVDFHTLNRGVPGEPRAPARNSESAADTVRSSQARAGPLRSAADSWLRRLRGPARPVLVDDGDDRKHEAEQPKTILP